MSSNPCPICKLDTIESSNTVEENLRIRLVCEHCGTFEVAEDISPVLSHFEARGLAIRPLVSYIIRRKESRTDFPLVTRDLIESIAVNGVLPTPKEQSENLILFLGKEALGPGEGPLISYRKDGAIFGVKTSSGIDFIISALTERKLITSESIKDHQSDYKVTLTYDGWELYESLKRGLISGTKAFMAMVYEKEETDKMFNDYFRNAVAKTGFTLERLDDKPRAGLIDDRLRVDIQTSRFIIADLTYNNNGAYWEAGYAEGLGKPVIYTCEKSHFKDKKKGTHFDTNHHLTVIWEIDKPDDAVKKLKATIRATIPEAKMSD